MIVNEKPQEFLFIALVLPTLLVNFRSSSEEAGPRPKLYRCHLVLLSGLFLPSGKGQWSFLVLGKPAG